MSEISWRPFSEEALTEAAQQNKPVLLSIVAPWCQFCRAMDEQTYGNDALARYIEENFIPVRVDSDKRPDINARYAQGGWPTTCILTPDGDQVWGGTFLSQEQMGQLLPQVLNAFHNDKQGLARHIAGQREQMQKQAAGSPLDQSLPVTPEITRHAVYGVKLNFDFANGGFGREQKFPHADAIELCLEQYSRSVIAGTPDEDMKIMLEKTLSGMAYGGMHDVEGGFFRYAQTPDWRQPQVEKLLEDNAQIARIFTRAHQLLGDSRWKDIAKKTLSFMDETLYIAERGIWGGSQAADSEYYSQPIAERGEWNPPTVDPTVLCGPNALAARAHAAWWQATGDDDALAKAKRGVDFLVENLLKPDGALDHFLAEDNETTAAALWGRVPAGLLGDAADMCAACLDLYEAGQGVDYLDNAEDIANWVRGHLEDPNSGGLFDSVVRPDAAGHMKAPTKDLTDNMQMADALLRLFLATGEQEHARLAQRILQAFIPAMPQLGFFGSGVAVAAERAILPPVLVHILGGEGDAQTAALLKAAHRPYRFERFVQPLDPANEEDAEHIENLEYPKPTAPVAYVSIATRRLDPITDPEKLSEIVESAS